MIDTAPRKMDRQEAISSLKRKHEDYFRSQGISNPYFTLKQIPSHMVHLVNQL